MNLLESKTLHHVTDVQVVQVQAKGRILFLLHMVEVELEHVGRFEEVGEWMALRRFDTREVRGHRSCPIHAVVVLVFFHFV